MNRRDFMRMTGLGMMMAGMPATIRAEVTGEPRGAPGKGATPKSAKPKAGEAGRPAGGKTDE